MMNPKVKKAWIDALRSGSYRQGQNSLCTAPDGSSLEDEQRRRYCCLGVLCELARVEGVVIRKPVSSVSHTATYVDHSGHATVGYPPDGALVWAGLSQDQPMGIQIDEVWVSFVGLNDFDRLTFSQIADLIERAENL